MSGSFFLLYLCTIPLINGLVLSNDSSSPLDIVINFKTDKALELAIFKNYSKIPYREVLSRPVTLNEDGSVNPITITVNCFIRDIRMENLDSGLYHWTADLTFRQNWNDKRLAYDVTGYPGFKFFNLNSYMLNNLVWKPDTFFPSTVKVELHHVSSSNSLLWVYPNGDLLYSFRATLLIRCHQIDVFQKEDGGGDLVCPLEMSSYGNTKEKIVYKWDEETPVELSKDLYIPGYEVEKVTTEEVVGSTRIGNFSAVNAKFHFTHK